MSWGYRHALPRHQRSRGLLVPLTVLALLTVPATASGRSDPEVAPAAGTIGTYANPVARTAADDFPDPSLIRGRDGYWYAYATRTPLVRGSETLHNLPIIRSRDLVSWEYVGDVFDASNRPSWFGPGSTVWGPAIEFIDGRYVLYFVGVDVPGHDLPNKSLGVATAPTPAGPWTASDAPLIAPQYYRRPPHNILRHRSLIAPDAVQDSDGRRYLYYGGFNGGIWGVPLRDDGSAIVGEAVQLVGDTHAEGPYVVRRGGWYYMFTSNNHCCLGGPVAGYTGWVVRSRHPLGPFVDRDGRPAKATYPGGTPVSFANGNRWVSPGVNTLTTDLAGQDWMVYHAVDREHPYLNGPFRGGLQRGLFIDRLDWIDGWPTVRAGRGPSEGPTPAPVTRPDVLADVFESGGIDPTTWTGTTGWAVATEPAGGYARTRSTGERLLLAREPWRSDTVVEAAVRTSEQGVAGIRLADHGGAMSAEVTVNAAARELAVTVKGAGTPPVTTTRALPATVDPAAWHELTAELTQGRLRVRVADVAADHPVADVRVPLPEGLVAGRLGLLARGGTADFDDVSVSSAVSSAAVPHDEMAPDPDAGEVDPALSDEFTDQPGGEWQWVREPRAEVADGSLVFPVQTGNVMGDNSDASLVTRSVPVDGEWTVQTRLDLDLGEAPLWGFPTAGLVVYAGDDEFLMQGVHGRNVVRDSRMIRETRYSGRVVTGNATTGAAGQPATWLRLHHTVDPRTGEHRFRGGSSVDGERWTWTTTYTMPADTRFRIGLIAVGASPDDAAVTARFDHLRVLRP